MLVPGPPAEDDRRALADLVRRRARHADAYGLASGVADDEDAVAVVDDHADLDRQAIGKRRAFGNQLKTLRTQEHVGGGARETPAGLGVRLNGPEAVEVDARRARVDPTGEKVAVADELAHEAGARPMINLERSEEHTSELQSLRHLVCRLLLEKKKRK